MSFSGISKMSLAFLRSFAHTRTQAASLHQKLTKDVLRAARLREGKYGLGIWVVWWLLAPV
jgi:hypothetical protein